MELEGVEPSSKQGTNLLSTCLSSFCLSGEGKTEATNPNLSLLGFAKSLRHAFNYLRFICTAGSNRFEATASGRCLVSATVAEIKLSIYYTSIKQRERKNFRQLIVVV